MKGIGRVPMERYCLQEKEKEERKDEENNEMYRKSPRRIALYCTSGGELFSLVETKIWNSEKGNDEREYGKVFKEPKRALLSLVET
jgi:hypothetical protein